MRQRGDGLSDRRQALRLHHGLMIARLLDGEGGLVRHGAGQKQMFAGELVRRFATRNSGAERIARRRAGIEIEHAERFMAALHRHADDLADAVADDALHGLKALVARHVGHEKPLFLAQYIIHEGAADGDFFLAVDAMPPAQRLGLKLGAIQHGRSGRCLAHRRLAQHDAAAVGVEVAKGHLQDALEELIEIEDLADGLRRLIHQIGQGVFQPRSLDLFGVGEDTAALGFADGLDDGRRQMEILTCNEADMVGKVAARRRLPVPLTRAGGIDEKGLADLDLVAGLEQHVADGLRR